MKLWQNIFVKRLILLALLYSIDTSAAFIISAKDSCGYSDNTYRWKIGSDVSYPDIRVRSGPDVSYPDFRIKLTRNINDADLIFVDHDELSYANKQLVEMSVCNKSSYPDRRLRIGPDVSYPDIRVRVGPNVSYADYKMYYSSYNFSPAEAAGLFPAIWEFNKK